VALRTQPASVCSTGEHFPPNLCIRSAWAYANAGTATDVLWSLNFALPRMAGHSPFLCWGQCFCLGNQAWIMGERGAGGVAPRMLKAAKLLPVSAADCRISIGATGTGAAHSFFLPG
jgi:hypothetical protein